MSSRGLPTFEGGDLPAPEPALRVALTRASAVAALLATVAYLTWRTLDTLDLSVWYLSLPLLALEVHAGISLALFAYSAWDIDGLPRAEPVTVAPGRVAVLIPTYNEPVEVLLPTISAAVALEPAHETWVLDDGDRPDVAALAARLGARYLTRPTHDHAKAGNVNHALGVVDADFVAVLDADHVALPGFLTHTLGYFADARIAVVQTPQDFYNVDSFEHEGRRRWLHGRESQRRFNEQALFYRIIQPGKNRWGAAFWCGTGAVVRVSALRSIGGVATESVTEDLHTTIRFHRRGWRSAYHNEVLARGLAAADADQYASQRLRWGTGAMQVLRTENPLTVPGLTARQRLAYAATVLGWFESWRSLGYLLLPPAVLLTGAAPIQASPEVFLPAFVTTFLLQQLALQRLGRGHAPALLATVFDIVRMAANLRATLTLFGRRSRPFTVTAKGRTGGDRRRTQEPVLLDAIAAATVVAGAWFVATLAGLTPLTYGSPWAARGAALWLIVNGALVWVGIDRIRDLRFGAERRASVRFDVRLPAAVDGQPVDAEDLSLTGAKVAVDGERFTVGGTHEVAIDLGGAFVRFDAEVRSVRPTGDGSMTVGLRFLAPDPDAQARLALALFRQQVIPDIEIEPGLARAS